MKLTIFTPTYNRADKLQRVYDSLIVQTSYDFEWLVIDDGSSDNTEAVVKGFDQSLFKIVYCKQKNGGKHTAYNRALELARGDYFFCVDSDDWLADQAVNEIINFVKEGRKNFILAYKEDEKGVRLSNVFPEGVAQLSLFNLHNEYHCNGEFSIIFRTDFASKFPFPIFKGEKFVTEAVIYDRMALVENISLLAKVVTICEYQDDGLSNNLNCIMRNNPAGYCLYFMQRIDLQQTMTQRIIMAGKYKCFCMFAKEKRTSYSGRHRKLVSLCTPIGFAFWVYYKLLRGF